MKSERKIIYENKDLNIKVYKNRLGKVEAIVDSENISANGITEFDVVKVFPGGIGLVVEDKVVALPFETKKLFKLEDKVVFFKTLFIFGDIAGSINGEAIRNFKY